MKSKEEIIKNVCPEFIGNVSCEDIYTVMDEYAKQECIEFAEWLTREDSPYAVLYGNRKERFATNENDYTVEQLYEMFLQTKK